MDKCCKFLFTMTLLSVFHKRFEKHLRELKKERVCVLLGAAYGVCSTQIRSFTLYPKSDAIFK